MIQDLVPGEVGGAGWAAMNAVTINSVTLDPVTGACRVLLADVRAVDQGLVGLLDADERDRHQRFRRQADRDRYLAGHALLRRVTGAYLGVDPASVRFGATCPTHGPGHGKPHLLGPGPAFSLSHSGDWVAVAVAGDPVGVDVETGRDSVEASLVGYVLSPAERRDFDLIPPERHADAFVTYWTRKEAVLKATGHGLSIAPARLSLSAPHLPAVLHGWDARAPRPDAVTITDLRPDAAHHAAVAVLSDSVTEITSTEATALISAT